jgi:AAA domain
LKEFSTIRRIDWPVGQLICVEWGYLGPNEGAGSVHSTIEQPRGGTMSNAVFTSLFDIKPETVKWLWEGRIPFGKVTLLESEPGVGKSTLTLELAARISRGAPMPLEKTHIEPANVLIFSGDDGLADTVRPRLDVAGADLSKIFSVDREFERDEIARFHPGLIILDPLPSYISTCCDRTAVDVMRKLGKLAKETGAAVLAVQTVGEDLKDHWTPEFYGTPRTVLQLTPIGHGGRRLALSKSNLRHSPDVFPLVYYIDNEAGQARIVNWSDGR